MTTERRTVWVVLEAETKEVQFHEDGITGHLAVEEWRVLRIYADETRARTRIAGINRGGKDMRVEEWEVEQ